MDKRRGEDLEDWSSGRRRANLRILYHWVWAVSRQKSAKLICALPWKKKFVSKICCRFLVTIYLSSSTFLIVIT